MQKRSYRNKSRPKDTQRGFSLFNLCLFTLFTLLSAYLIFLIITYNMLAFRSLNLLLIGALLLIFLIALILLLSRRAKWFARGLLLIATALVGFGTFLAKSTVDVANELNYRASFSQVDMSVIVAKDSSLEDVEAISHLLTPSNDDVNVEELLTNLKEQRGFSPETKTVDSYLTAYENILENKDEAMVLNSAYVSLLEGQDPDFADKIKTIYTTSVEKEIVTKEETKETDGDVFNVYISGIDSYGPVSAVSRSDVNLIMTVNRKANKILITTTPRDSYLPIAGGGNNQYDKLTHAGLYGVNSSIATLENLYGIAIDYYVRLNFTSFLQIIDMIGGVQVYNEQAFTSIHSGQHYPAGELDLNAEQALDFVRERYGLEDGDNDRGKNQEKVLAGIIKKLTSTSALTSLPTVVSTMADSVQTNMPLTSVMALANDQLDKGTSFEVISQALGGSGSTGQLQSHAMPNASLYMFSIDNNSLQDMKATIKEVMEEE